jgi:hypothetical protein
MNGGAARSRLEKSPRPLGTLTGRAFDQRLKSALASERAIPPDVPMQLTDEQKQKVAAWISEGMKLSDIQVRLGQECGLSLTYMDVRFLVDDLKLTPKDAPAPAPEKVEPVEPVPPAASSAPTLLTEDSATGQAAAKVSLTVDQIAKPATIVSGMVTFSDGKTAQWYLDQQGRLGVVPTEQGYRPPEGDVEIFQTALDRELAKMGY